MLDNYDERLKLMVLEELTDRARGGIFIYALIWFSSTLWADLHFSQPVFFWFNTLLIVLVCLARLMHYISMKIGSRKKIDRLSQCFIISVLLGALHWGVMTAWVSSQPGYEEVHYIFIIATTAFAMAGTSNLGISKEIRLLFPYFTLLPIIIMSLFVPQEEKYFIVFLGVFSLIYISSTSKIAAADYSAAVHNNMLATDRALQLERLNNTDPLTKLHNRVYFDKQYLKELKRCTRAESSITLMMIDLDHFKQVNDSYGHQFGDFCLMEVAKVLAKFVARESDVVARYGGEEFIVMLPATDVSSAEQVARKIIQSVACLGLVFEGEEVMLGCSIGLHSIVPKDGADGYRLIKLADEALYTAKNTGRNRYHIFESAGAHF